MTAVLRYRWTTADVRIASGDTTDSAQGPYVTPYGIPAGAMSGCRSYAAGDEREVDLAKSVAGEPWRMRRFKREGYDWHDLSEIGLGAVPESVTTLGELCEHLRRAAGWRFPDEYYDSQKVATPGMDNIAQLIFDQPKNTDYRYAVVSSPGFDWKTYLERPGKLPFRASNGLCPARIRTTKITLPTAPTAPRYTAQLPAAQPVVFDQPTWDLAAYARSIEDEAAHMDWLYQVCEQTTRQRFDVVFRLTALQAIAEVGSETGALVGKWPELATEIEEVLPRVQEALTTRPIAGRATDWVAESLTTHPHITLNAVEELEASRQRLLDLLDGGAQHRFGVQAWVEQNRAALEQGAPAEATAIANLAGAIQKGLVALANTWFPEDGAEALAARLLASLKQTPFTPISGSDAVPIGSPPEVVLKTLGKAIKLNSSAAKLSSAILMLHTAHRLPAMARELSDLNRGIMTHDLWLAKWKVFGDELIDHLPAEGDLRARMKLALMSGKQSDVVALRDEWIAADGPGAVSDPLTFKGAMFALTTVSFTLSLRDAITSIEGAKDFGTVTLAVVDCMSTVASGAKLVGEAGKLLKALGDASKHAKALVEIGSFGSMVGSVIGIVTGTWKLLESIEKGDVLGGMAAGATLVAGSLEAAVMLGISAELVPGVNVIATVAMCAGAVLELVKAILEHKVMTDQNRIMGSLVRQLRTSPCGGWVQQFDPAIMAAFGKLVTLSEDGLLPALPNDLFTAARLRRAGVSRGVIAGLAGGDLGVMLDQAVGEPSEG